MKDFADKLNEFKDANRMYHFEGESGVAKLEKIVEAIGYRRHGFRYGNPVEVFLADNPGAIDAILEFIEAHAAPEWEETLEEAIGYDPAEDAEEYEEEDA